MSDGGKGSGRRPGSGYQDAWERIFGNKKPAPQQPAKPSAPHCTASKVQGKVQ
jgi:hypothetical protein